MTTTTSEQEVKGLTPRKVAGMSPARVLYLLRICEDMPGVIRARLGPGIKSMQEEFKAALELPVEDFRGKTPEQAATLGGVYADRLRKVQSIHTIGLPAARGEMQDELRRVKQYREMLLRPEPVDADQRSLFGEEQEMITLAPGMAQELKAMAQEVFKVRQVEAEQVKAETGEEMCGWEDYRRTAVKLEEELDALAAEFGVAEMSIADVADAQDAAAPPPKGPRKPPMTRAAQTTH
jgi:hypothetical protein